MGYSKLDGIERVAFWGSLFSLVCCLVIIGKGGHMLEICSLHPTPPRLWCFWCLGQSCCSLQCALTLCGGACTRAQVGFI
jgi:hypothetical protein